MREGFVSGPEDVGCHVRTSGWKVARTAGWLVSRPRALTLVVSLDFTSRFMNVFVFFVAGFFACPR